MIHKIRESKVTKIVASYLAIQLMITTIQPTTIYALTSGPSQPEFNSFTPIGTSDMVNLSSGNFNYNIPVMDVGGYPLNLSYDSGITMDQEASWVGLGWNLNVGQINRQVRGIPDDFKGDEITYENNMKDNVTVSLRPTFDPQVFGLEQSDLVNLGFDLKYNNYTGLSFSPSYGLSFGLSESVSVGVNVETSDTEGVTISPRINAKSNLKDMISTVVDGTLSAGVSYNSNKGLSDFSISAGVSVANRYYNEKNCGVYEDTGDKGIGVISGSGRMSFLNNTLTPRKRTAFRDISGTLSLSVGADVWGLDGEVEVSATGIVQQVKDKIKTEKAFGYEFTGFASSQDVLDYNREKDQLISKSTLVLPTTSYTYDLYSVQGQGTGGMFRPFRSQIGQINDEYVKDEGTSFGLGVEIEPGSGFHFGVNFTNAPSVSSTGLWDTKALKHFKQTREDKKESGDAFDYEPVYFKFVGEPRVDKDEKLFEDLGGYSPIALKIGGRIGTFDRYADSQFKKKIYNADGTPKHVDLPAFNTKFKRKIRDIRNQGIQKISASEMNGFYDETYASDKINKNSKPHHTAEIRVLQGDGGTYVYGETAYNTLKKEVTFTTDSKNYNCAEGTVQYLANENTRENRSGIDRFFNATHTPAYAHTYLLSAVLSSDYEDVKGDGPTDDDMGSYTKFSYKTFENYQWRVPYNQNEASYNAGLNTNPSDQKGSYIYGQKELKYIHKIETKTHIAVFDVSARKDGRGVDEENGGGSSSSASMYKIDKIRLYSKPEYKMYEEELEDDKPENDPGPDELAPIKTAHFIYDYSQCQGIDNNLGGTLDAHEQDYIDKEGNVSNNGKLTLKKVYFTYRNSRMGKYTPYQFNYDGFNPDYNLKSYDVWGNYKPNQGGCNTEDTITAPEFPFVQQQDRSLQDQYASAWTMTSIDLPSGGAIALDYESDDYTHVQNRDAMQMFKVIGAGVNSQPTNPESNTKLYTFRQDGIDYQGDVKYLYVQLPDENNTDFDFEKKYLKGIANKPMYFRFLMNMTKAGALSTGNNNFDYVTGYFELDKSLDTNVFEANGKVYVAIPMQFTDMEGGLNAGKDVNPISKAGWYFGRQNLNGWVYGLNMDARSQSIVDIGKRIVSSFAAIKDIFTGPNQKLRSNGYLCAQRFVPEKSWIRLSVPKSYKLGGGARVRKLIMKDQWAKMLQVPENDEEKYTKEYGQEYKYALEDGSSSGVATYEPNMSRENPFVEPFYNKGERLIAPREISYVEKPFGESFFPGATVTYSRVEVSNLSREGITKHATGKVVSEYFTSKNYPTIVDYTDIDSPSNYKTDQDEVLKNLIKGIFSIPVKVKHEYSLSQGFVVHTNDMNGKQRSQKVYAEGQEKPISSVEYKYSTQEEDITKLSNKLPVIFKDGSIMNKEIGVDYDVVTDFRESYNKSTTEGYKGNIVVLIIGIFPIPVPLVVPSSNTIQTTAHTTMTTKVIHTTAVMKEKVAMDLGSKITTTNEAWDAETGEVLLTKTVNEFDDQYYNFNFPAHWSYDEMGHASRNLGNHGVLTPSGDYFTMTDAGKYLVQGDEVLVTYQDGNKERLWIVGFNDSKTGVLLMDELGVVLNRSARQIDDPIRFKVIRSGYRNQLGAKMGSVTLMKNPLQDNQGNWVDNITEQSFYQPEGGNPTDHKRIVNASAVAYDDFWNCPCENGLESIPYATPDSDELADLSIEEYGFNPYLYNVKGEWRAEKSYAYLTERIGVTQGGTDKQNTRKEGYLKEFTPFYVLKEGKWIPHEQALDQWTFASEVTQYTAFGPEIENKDALDRYSSAQYGYNMTLPIAVASNSKYRYMGADNFEDYNYLGTDQGHYSFKEQVTGDGDKGIQVSDAHAHTGNTSLWLPDKGGASMITQLQGQEIPDNDADNDGWKDDEDNCPYTYNRSQSDYDGDGIGDTCDDNAVPIITDVKKSGQFRGWREQATFVVQGTPNTEVVCKIIPQSYGNNGAWISVNGDKFWIGPRNYTVQIGPTGRAVVQFEVRANRGKRRWWKTRPNRIAVDFRVMHRDGETPVYNSPVIRLDPVGWRNLGSGSEHGAVQLFPSIL